MTTKRSLAIIGALWLVILGVLIVSKEFTLRTGQEIVLATVPVDPRDLFRGDYVTLRYQISSLDLTRLPSDRSTFTAGETVYVSLASDGSHHVATRLDSRPPHGSLFLRGTAGEATGRDVSVLYGIESYFVPEGKGRELESARGHGLDVRVAVDRFGRGVIQSVAVNPQQPPASWRGETEESQAFVESPALGGRVPLSPEHAASPEQALPSMPLPQRTALSPQPMAQPVLLIDDFEDGAIAPQWQLLRMQFEERDGGLFVVSAPRPGFEYGHDGHGRSAAIMTHIGDPAWTDYRIDLDVFAGGPGALNPHGIDDCVRGGFTVYFRTQDYQQSWNEPGRTSYAFGVNHIPDHCEGQNAPEWSLGKARGWYIAQASGWGPQQGVAKTLVTGQGNPWKDDDVNHVRIDVVDNRISISVNGAPDLAYIDEGSEDDPPLLFGGMGVVWEWDNTGWVDNVVVTRLQ
ncbi:MAG: GDYXXLXY domain-containing protein [Candidatus Omnitrophica bacterium]|nr:GDYXXLXY domain-containing protein [Candidatus Omnitrophota bacterium]